MISKNAHGYYVDRTVGGSRPTELDYGFDFSRRLRLDEGITSFEVTCEDLLVDRESLSGARVSVFVTGGIAGRSYKLICTIVTDQSRVITAVLTLRCVVA